MYFRSIVSKWAAVKILLNFLESSPGCTINNLVRFVKKKTINNPQSNVWQLMFLENRKTQGRSV